MFALILLCKVSLMSPPLVENNNTHLQQRIRLNVHVGSSLIQNKDLSGRKTSSAACM